uniref:Major facilitator transporter n=1 Tax=uncultured bacterium UPO57 TaxID=1776980 RepID=A0A126SYK9_9BACT|nr:major facilitator transporter [uncultured bacterium UPO57]
MQSEKPPGANAIFFIFITVLINMIGFGIIMPVMPQLIMAVTGQDLSHAAKWGGVLSFAYAATQFFMMPVVGALSDRYGRRPVILGSLGAYSLDFLLMALAPTVGFLLAARLLSGAFSATFTTANAFIADITPPEKRAASFGLMGAAFGVGFIIGPGVGGLLGDHFGPRAPFFTVAALGALNLVYGYFFLPETHARENRRRFEWKRANALGNFISFRQYPALLPIALCILLYQLAHWTMPSVWAYYAEERFGWSPADIGYSLMAMGLAAAIVQGGLARIALPKIGERAAAFTGITIALFSYLGFGFATKEWMIYALIPVSALGGFTLPALQGIMSRTLPANAQGELQGAIGSIAGLSMIIGPFAMTQIFAAFVEPGTPFYVGEALILPAGAPFYFPGAPFVAAALLAALALIPLGVAVRRRRAKPVKETQAAEAA